MGNLVEIMTPLHTSTKRDYLGRLLDDKIACMKKAREFEKDYWDGDRRYGYGGYNYQPGRWKPVAEALISRYDLKAGDSVLDLGCGKGFLLYEMQLLLPGLELTGLDRSAHGIAGVPKDLKALLINDKIQGGLTRFPDKSFDLVISLITIQNLRLAELWEAIPEIQRVSRKSYLMTEAYRNEEEWFNLVAWCLTAETILRPEDWVFLYKQCGYTGDYEFIYFQ